MVNQQVYKDVMEYLSEGKYLSLNKRQRIKILIREQQEEVEELNDKMNRAIKLTQDYNSGIIRNELLKIFMGENNENKS